MSSKAFHLIALMVFSSAPIVLLAQANTFLSNLSNPTSVNRSLIPSAHNTHSLGSAAKSWRDIFISGYYYLHNNRTISGNLALSNFYAGYNAGNIAATGTRNHAFGVNALRFTTSGYANIAGGSYSLYNNSTGYENTSYGVESGRYNSSGFHNTFVGYRSGYNNSTGKGNSFVGYQAGYNNTFSQYSSAFGFQALYNNTNINYNSAFGAFAAFSTTGGGYNAAFGYQALRQNTSGGFNSAYGSSAMYSNKTGDQNAAFGYQAGMIANGDYNSYFGAYAGSTIKGSNNTFIGYHAGGFVDSVKNSTALGYYTITTASNQVRIGDLNVTSIGGYRPWSNISDGRFKKDIKENVPGLAFINKLRPVTYVLKVKELDDHLHKFVKNAYAEGRTPARDDQTIITGFVAQEVEAAAKELDYTFDGVDAPKNEHDLYALRYSEFVVPLVQAVQELSKLNQQKDSVIAELKEAINELARKDGRTIPFGGQGSLSQNYPDPARHSTVIGYALPQHFSQAQILVTDASGKRLVQLPLAKTATGNISLNTSTFASGVYNYSLVVDDRILQTRKMIVVR